MTTQYPIADYDTAYSNSGHVAGSADYPLRWAAAAKRFREAIASSGRARLAVSYGSGERNRYDLFLPEGAARGLVVFFHGGYWRAFDGSSFSHLAAGPLAHGFAVAVPSYTLCPAARIRDIGLEAAAAVAHAAEAVSGPILVSGHSAGGHLAARLVSEGSALSPAVMGRIAHVVPISGVHDLRPVMKTEINQTLGLDADEARAESPALLVPIGGCKVTAWAGAAELSEFVRQNRVLAEIWKGFGISVDCVEEPGRHHYDVVEGLADPDHALTRTLVGA